MDPVMIIIIVAIIAAIILVEFNKQQKTKASDNAHSNAYLQELYLLKAAEFKINTLNDLQSNFSITNGPDASAIAKDLAEIKSAFEKGEIPLKEFNFMLDNLLNSLDAGNTSFAQAC